MGTTQNLIWLTVIVSATAVGLGYKNGPTIQKQIDNLKALNQQE